MHNGRGERGEEKSESLFGFHIPSTVSGPRSLPKGGDGHRHQRIENNEREKEFLAVFLSAPKTKTSGQTPLIFQFDAFILVSPESDGTVYAAAKKKKYFL